jgi:hypothetical protein
VRYDGDAATGQGDHVVVEPLERESMKIDEVSRDLKLGQLSLPTLKVFRPSHPSIEQQRGLIQLAAGMDEHLVRRNIDSFRN